MKIAELFTEASMIPELRSQDKPTILAELGERLALVHGGVSAEVVTAALCERETIASTAIGDGVALPHGRLGEVRRLVGAIGRASEGVAFESLDGQPTHLFFGFVAPDWARDEILAAFGQLARLFKAAPALKDRLLDAAGPREMLGVLAAADGIGGG